jgi:hypothetical protein
MSFKFIADTFSVARDSEHFLQLKTLKKPGTDDQVWVAIEIVGDSKYSRATAQSVIDTMEDVFFEQSELGVYERFEQALKEVNIILGSLREKRKKSFGQINAIIAVLSGNELHLTQSNSAEAYLIRNNKFSMISEGLGSRSEDLFVNIASGELMTDDKLIFSTARLLRLATHSQIVQLFADGVAEAIEAIRELTINDESLSMGVVTLHAKMTQKAMPEILSRGNNKYLLKLKQLIKIASDFVIEKTEKHKASLNGANTKKILIAIGAAALVLIISVSFLVQNQRNSAIREEYKTKIQNLYQDITTANTKNYANDSASANAILDKVDKEARSILETNYFRPEALALLDKLQETRDSINNTNRVKKMAPYIDLSTKSPDVKAQGLLSLNDNLFAYEYNKIYQIILDQVLDPKTIDGTEVVVAGTAMEDQSVLVFLTQSGRVIEYDKGQVGFANTEDQAWKSGVAIAAYGKYIYILNPGDNQIYKYARLRSKYSNAATYNDDADIKDAIAMTIDGDVYVLKKGGTIIRLNKGKQQPFKVDNLAVDISTSTKVFTSSELDNLYILDPTNKRVVIVTKPKGGSLTSKYYGQVVFPELENIQDIYVDKGEAKLYVLTDKEVYKIDI